MFTLLQEIKSAFTPSNLKHDLSSGLVVFLVALPLCLGIALASGVSLFSGIITGLVGGMLVSLLSGSSLSVSGPAAGLTIIVFNAVQKLGSLETFLLAVFIAGILQLLMGFFNAGNIGKFFPSSVIKGMLAAIGIILILKQIPHAVGYDKDYEGDFTFFQPDNENTLTEIFAALNKTNPGAIIIALVSIMILILWERPFMKKLKLVPGPLIVVIAGVLINKLFMLTNSQFAISAEHLVNLPETRSLKEFTTHFMLPDFSQVGNIQVYITAVTLAIVASLETLLSVEAIDKLDPERRNTPNNRELKAQGIGNIISGLIGGLPMTAVIVRGSANINAGAKSKASSFIHGSLLLLAVLFLYPYINLIPLSALAGILLMTGYKLTKLSLIKGMYKQGWIHFIPFGVTIIAILFTDLLIGITIGMVVGFFFILKTNAGNAFYLRKKVFNKGNSYTIVLSEEVTFLNKAHIADTLESIPANSTVLIDGAKSKFIDDDVMEIINDYKVKAQRSNINVQFTGINISMRTGRLPTNGSDFHYKQLFSNNRAWIQTRLQLDPDYFEKLAEGQEPDFLLIGCSDSRVDPNEITGTNPGDMFVHRNIANLVVDSDHNLAAVLQYSVEVLKIKHIIICGHYGCGGVLGAMQGGLTGPIDHWLANIRQTYTLYEDQLIKIEDYKQRANKLVEFNVTEQVNNLYNNKVIRKAITQGIDLKLHGWVYEIHTGTIKELAINDKRVLVEDTQI